MAYAKKLNENRINSDLMKLFEKYEVKMDDSTKMNFCVKFEGPKDTPYEDGIWAISVHLPKEYPFKSPSVAFRNIIFHPNIDITTGSICLNVINQTWTALYDLRHIFDWFLPQLLTYPNPTDPINVHAAAFFLGHKEDFQMVCREYVKLYASKEKAWGFFTSITGNAPTPHLPYSFLPPLPPSPPPPLSATAEKENPEESDSSSVSELSGDED